MNKNKAVALCAAVGVAVVGIAIAVPAHADPISNSYVLVGSDTLQDVSNALVNGTSVSGPSVRVVATSTATLGSFDAFGSSTIRTTATGGYFGRPAGSGDGVKALGRSIDGGAYTASSVSTVAGVLLGQVDIARSSGSPAVPNASGTLAYVPFARDAVSYGYAPSTSGDISALTQGQLHDIYSCVANANVINGVTIQPLLPQAGSGTRKFFLAQLGIADSTAAACVTTNATNPQFATVNENDGTALSVAGEIVPFSVANWIAQSNAVAPARLGTAALGNPLGTATPPFNGTGTSLSANSAYYSSTVWGRDTYMVVEYARINSSDPKFDAGLLALMDPSNTSSLTNFSTGSATTGAVKKKFGFMATANNTILRATAQ